MSGGYCSGTARTRWRESKGSVLKESIVRRVGELVGHCMRHCELESNSLMRDTMLAFAMDVYRELR